MSLFVSLNIENVFWLMLMLYGVLWNKAFLVCYLHCLFFILAFEMRHFTYIYGKSTDSRLAKVDCIKTYWPIPRAHEDLHERLCLYYTTKYPKVRNFLEGAEKGWGRPGTLELHLRRCYMVTLMLVCLKKRSLISCDIMMLDFTHSSDWVHSSFVASTFCLASSFGQKKNQNPMTLDFLPQIYKSSFIL